MTASLRRWICTKGRDGTSLHAACLQALSAKNQPARRFDARPLFKPQISGDVTVSKEKEECAKGSCASFVVKSLLPFPLLLLLVVLG